MGCQVDVRNVRKVFKTDREEPVFALKDVDLTARSGQFYVLVGDSGSGKTTLLRSIAGLETPDSGEIALRGQPVFSSAAGISIPPEDRRIGMVFQSYAIWPHLTVMENISVPLMYGRQRLVCGEARRRANEALETVGLAHLADRPAPKLSGGQQQRVALARAIAVGSELLLMDEPMSNLDARLREEVRNQMRSVARHYGTTVVYVTHDQEEAMSLADEIAMMRHGQILQRGTPKQLYEDSATLEIADFFGPMNHIAGTIAGPGNVRTPIGDIRAETKLVDGTSVTVGIRPERIRLTPGPGENVFDGIVVDRVYLGARRTYDVKLGDVIVQAISLEDFSQGQPVKVGLPATALRVFARTDAPHRSSPDAVRAPLGAAVGA